MSSLTTNYNLKKPAVTDFYNIGDFNDNFDTIDTTLTAKADRGHTHEATDLASGTIDIARIPTGEAGTTVALGNHNHDSAYARKTAVLTDTQSTEKTVALLDNTEYRFGTLTALTATLPETTTYEVYIRFTAGTGVTVSGLTSVIWSGGAPEWVAGNIYEVSIKDGYGVMAAYEVSA